MVAIQKKIGFHDVDQKALLQSLKFLLTNSLVLKYSTVYILNLVKRFSTSLSKINF